VADIFISYATEDRERLSRLRELLEIRGWSVFWDEKTPVGKNWRRTIFEKLKASRCVIVAWSHASLESDWVTEEAADALKRDVLFPVLIDPVQPPFGFADVQAMSLVGWNGAEDAQPFRRLVDEVARILGTQPTITSEPRPKIENVEGANARRRRQVMASVGVTLIIAAATALWLYTREPETTASADETAARDVSVGGDGIAVGRDLNNTGDIKFGD
jgi:hypothetical protein